MNDPIPVIIQSNVISKILNLMLPIFTTFLGAGVAFYAQNKHIERKKKDTFYNSLIQTQALFYFYLEFIQGIKIEYLDQFKDDSRKEMKIQNICFCDSFPELDYKNLSLLLETKKPDLYAEIHSLYRKCLSVVDSIRDRNQQYLKMKDNVKGVNSDGSMIVETTIVEANFLKDYTNIMYREVNQCFERINLTDMKIQEYIKSNFKGKHALSIGNKTTKNLKSEDLTDEASES